MNGSVSITKSWVFRLIVVNVIIFVLQMLIENVQIIQTIVVDSQAVPVSRSAVTFFLGLSPANVIERYYVWEVFTYMFLHANFLHLFVNMYALFLFGIPIEQAWGGRRFLFFYFFTGVGAGLTILVLNTVLGDALYYVPTIGASGAIFGVLLAFGILFPDVEILIFFVIPLKAKFMVLLYGGLEVMLLLFSRGQSNISHIGHVGGLIFGIIFFFLLRRHGIRFKTKLMRARLQKNLDRKDTAAARESIESEQNLDRILQKVKAGGAGALSDDEYQYVKYLEIMQDSDNSICDEHDFDKGDAYCKKCANYKACMIREIKKYIE